MNKDERFCTDCQQWKAPSEFYTRKSTKSLSYTSYCKSCYKVRSKNHVKSDKRETTVPSEGELIKELWKQGIPALPGKSFSHAYADVVCWSCVFVEVKWARRNGRLFKFGFTYEQKKGGLRGHVIALMLDWGDRTTYHLFDARSPLFYRADGKLKTAVTYTVDKLSKGRGHVFTPEIMAEAENNWGLIESYRKSISEKLINGADFIHEVQQIRKTARKYKI